MQIYVRQPRKNARLAVEVEWASTVEELKSQLRRLNEAEGGGWDPDEFNLYLYGYRLDDDLAKKPRKFGPLWHPGSVVLMVVREPVIEEEKDDADGEAFGDMSHADEAAGPHVQTRLERLFYGCQEFFVRWLKCPRWLFPPRPALADMETST